MAITREIFGSLPDGTAVESYPDERGYVLHRKLFDADLAAMAAEAGAEIRTKAYVCGLVYENGRLDGVQLRHLGHTYSIRASIVVGADGANVAHPPVAVQIQQGKLLNVFPLEFAEAKVLFPFKPWKER